MKWERMVSEAVGRHYRAARVVGIDPDDLLQVGRQAAYRAEQSWDPEGGRSLSSWVWLQLDYDLRDELRKVPPTPLEQLNNSMQAPVESPESATAVRRAVDYLRAHLPDREWSALWLLHAEGYGPQEVAARLGLTLSPSAARKWLSRARQEAAVLLVARDQATSTRRASALLHVDSLSRSGAPSR